MKLKIRFPILFFLLWICFLAPALNNPAARMAPGDEGEPGGPPGHDSAERPSRSEETDPRARPASRPEGWAGKHSLSPGSGWIDRNSGPRPRMEQPERSRAGTEPPAALSEMESTESPAASSTETWDSDRLPDSVSEPDGNPEVFPEDLQEEGEAVVGEEDFRGLPEGEPEAADGASPEDWQSESRAPAEKSRTADPGTEPRETEPFSMTAPPPE